MPFFRIKKIWIDHNDGMVQFDLSLSNDSIMVNQDFYDYPDGELFEFAKKLQSFPKSLDDTISYQYGEKAYYAYVLLQAFYNGIQVRVSNNKEKTEHQSADFFIECEPLVLNRIGQSLDTWLQGSMKDYMEESW